MAKADDSLPDGFSNPNSGTDDDEQDASMDPGETVTGTYLGIQSQGEGEYSPWYITQIKTDEGMIRRFAEGDFKSAITNENIEIGDEIYYEKAEEPRETEEYGEFYPVVFGVK